VSTSRVLLDVPLTIRFDFVMRGMWGSDIMSDWQATHSTISAARGLDVSPDVHIFVICVQIRDLC
jgi:hypothetical protein